MFYPLLFEPNLHRAIWGGNKLSLYKGIGKIDDSVGESWEVSSIPTSVSVIANGEWKGKDLNTIISNYPDAILGKKVNDKFKGKLPLLVKFIDA